MFKRSWTEENLVNYSKIPDEDNILSKIYPGLIRSNFVLSVTSDKF